MPLSPLLTDRRHSTPQDNHDGGPPMSPTTPTTPNPSQEECDWSRNKYGAKARFIRRMSSTEWEHPMLHDGAQFAKVTNDDDNFHVSLDLNFFPNYTMDEIDVDVFEYDILIHARKENPNDPNHALNEINRQYRLPDDVDLETVKVKKNKKMREVAVDAKKQTGYGKDVQYNVFDSKKHPLSHVL
uniref:SHSP domain-containing protein n=1 Tax=Panagrellus redivivus TaxID=6233 RepID=A0A7E4VXL2_PANRE